MPCRVLDAKSALRVLTGRPALDDVSYALRAPSKWSINEPGPELSVQSPPNRGQWAAGLPLLGGICATLTLSSSLPLKHYRTQ